MTRRLARRSRAHVARSSSRPANQRSKDAPWLIIPSERAFHWCGVIESTPSLSPKSSSDVVGNLRFFKSRQERQRGGRPVGHSRRDGRILTIYSAAKGSSGCVRIGAHVGAGFKPAPTAGIHAQPPTPTPPPPP